MKITNKHNLPEEIVNAILRERYIDPEEDPFDYSASSLIAPIQATILKKRHPAKLVTRDVVDFFWQFMGSIAHNVLEEAWHESMGGMAERRLYAPVSIDGKRIVLSGKMDNYADRQVRDYKTCKAYKIVKGGYEDWEKQLNIYAYICRHNNFPVESLRVYALIFDWKEQESSRAGYPECPIVSIPLRLWDEEVQERYICSRIASLLYAETLTDEEISQKVPCSEHEMWQETKDYAVMKEGATRAYRTFDTEEEASALVEEMNEKNHATPYVMAVRKTERRRCLKYCDAANVCQQNQQLLKEESR